MSAAGRRHALFEFRNSRRSPRVDQPEQVRDDEPEAYDPATHFGYGTSNAPLAKSGLLKIVSKIKRTSKQH